MMQFSHRPIDGQGIAVMLCSASTVEPDVDVHRQPKGQKQNFCCSLPMTSTCSLPL